MAEYQVVIFENGAGKEGDALRATLRERFSELHIEPAMLRFLSEHDLATRNPKAPTVAVYFGLTPGAPAPCAAVETLLSEGIAVVPVVSDLAHYSNFVPPELKPVNGTVIDPADPDKTAIAAALLENLNLLRKSRRVFLSYRRSETRQIAVQLYEELDARTFDVFLDTLSIRPGEPFQEILWHRLADTDVMVLLDSPEYLASRWTAEELAHANSTSIQTLQILWPGTQQPAEAAFSTVFDLSTVDFEGTSLVGADARLKSDAIRAIAMQVETVRARGLAARQAFLLREFCKEAHAAGLNPTVQPNQFIHLANDTSSPVVIVPTIGVPDAVRYQDLEEELQDQPGAEIVLVYDNRGVRQRWQQHLEWLDARMPVRSLRVSAISNWVRERKGKGK